MNMYFLPMWCSFLSFVVSALFGRHLGSRGVYIYSVFSIFICVVSSCYIFYEVSICQSVCYIRCATWLSIDLIEIHWGFLFDSLSASMLVVITAISLCAHIYSIEYMRTDPHNVRFFSYLSLFTCFMILLVVSDNVVQLFLGWEGVGICSYLLINFWSTRIQANKSSLLAVITNKLGDIALLISCTVLYSMFKTVDFAVLNACAEYMPKMRDDFLFADSLEPVRPAEFYSSDYEKLLHSVFFQVHAFIIKMLRLYGADAAVDVIASYLYVLEADVGKHPTPISDEIYRLRKEAIASSEELEVNRSWEANLIDRCVTILDSCNHLSWLEDASIRDYHVIKGKYFSNEDGDLLANKFKLGDSVHKSSRVSYTDLHTLNVKDVDAYIQSVKNNNIGSFELEEQFFKIRDIKKHLLFDSRLLTDTLARKAQVTKNCNMLEESISAIKNQIRDLSSKPEYFTEDEWISYEYISATSNVLIPFFERDEVKRMWSCCRFLDRLLYALQKHLVDGLPHGKVTLDAVFVISDLQYKLHAFKSLTSAQWLSNKVEIYNNFFTIIQQAYDCLHVTKVGSVYIIKTGHMLFEQLPILCFLLLIAAVGKSAQAGLHIWLPEAMEGPTPVSSLIHAATMVTAGIFLLVRCSYLFFNMSTMFVYIILFGSLTAFFSSTIGLLQTDIKKVVAYSTCSQLGYMFVCCGFSAYGNGMFHLFNHAFFKALLFLTAGYVIHALSNEQDIRKMGSLLTVLPFSYVMIIIGSLSLVGFPFFSGFYSKDRIIELCFNNYQNAFSMFDTYKYIMFSQLLCIFAVIFTLIYSMKLIFFVFFNSYCGFKLYLHSLHFSSFFIQIPLLFLSVLSIVSGYLTSDMMVGVGTSFWLKSFHTDTFFFFGDSSKDLYKSSFLLHTEYNHYIRQITVVWTIYFLFVSFVLVTHFKYFFYYSFIGSLHWFRQLFTMIVRKYLFINRILVVRFVGNLFTFSYSVVYRMFDKGVIELLGPFGIVYSIQSVLYSQYKLQSGLVYHYSGFLLLMLIFCIHFFFDFLFI